MTSQVGTDGTPPPEMGKIVVEKWCNNEGSILAMIFPKIVINSIFLVNFLRKFSKRLKFKCHKQYNVTTFKPFCKIGENNVFFQFSSDFVMQENFRKFSSSGEEAPPPELPWRQAPLKWFPVWKSLRSRCYHQDLSLNIAHLI